METGSIDPTAVIAHGEPAHHSVSPRRSRGAAAPRRVAAFAIASAVAGLLAGCGASSGKSAGPASRDPAATPPTSTTTGRPAGAGGTPVTGGTTIPGGTTIAGRTTSSTTPVPTSGYQPLWPFRTLQEAVAWQRGYRSGGHQPWHLDPGQTAVSFASGYLGYTDIRSAFRTALDASGAHVTVGFNDPNGHPVNAAVVHLRRFGTGGDAPWEVVGTDDTTLSLTAPRYGAMVRSPLAIGGTVSGVDERIRVQVRQPSSTSPLGTSCCQPAGGTASRWTATVSFQGATDGVVTVAASTGGHLATVERFTVVGLRTASGPATAGL